MYVCFVAVTAVGNVNPVNGCMVEVDWVGFVVTTLLGFHGLSVVVTPDKEDGVSLEPIVVVGSAKHDSVQHAQFAFGYLEL